MTTPTDQSNTSRAADPTAHGEPVDAGRRDFFAKVGGLTTAALIPGAAGLSALVAPQTAEAVTLFPNANTRAQTAYTVRVNAARLQRLLPLAAHPANTDEDLYANRIGSFHKALPHNALGEVSGSAYNSYLAALSAGSNNFALMEAVPLGGTVKLANPMAAFAYAMEGPDSHHTSMPAAPALASAHAAAEMVEVYWRALTRDVPFTDYATDPTIAAAVADLNLMSDYRGPTDGGMVTSGAIFRGQFGGDLDGPFLSQFLWQNIPFGLASMPQQYIMPVSGSDFMTTTAEWLAIQNGAAPTGVLVNDPTPRYISNGRDLAEWVHRDFPYQAFLDAALILLGYGGAALDAGNPYAGASKQGAFVTFGAVHVLDLVTRVARQALQAAWFQKWLVHRRVRPEAYGGLVHWTLTGDKIYPVHSDVLSSDALSLVSSTYGSYLLPMAYPEGCPTHPAYPAGHATISGACATVLKAFFKESFAIPTPVEATDDGSALTNYGGVLTVGGELNKLAANVSLARDTAGVHYRSDGVEGMLLGEQVAIGMLSDYAKTYREGFGGFSLTRFNGTTITVGA